MKILTLDKIYTADKIEFQKSRYKKASEEFETFFGMKPEYVFSAPGRTEICGNHTDHNSGKVLAGGVSLDVIAMVVPTDDNKITIKSEGFEIQPVDLSSTAPVKTEQNTTESLIRGMADGFLKNNFRTGGFKAYTTSNVLKGSGLSSSASFEVLVGTILNGIYNGGQVPDIQIAQIAQYAENVHFGKPSGLMDQMASSVGGFITIDFKDEKSPVVRSIDFDFSKSGYTLCIVDTKGNHSDLTPDYSAIPSEMKSVAEFFGKSVLREITKNELLENIGKVRQKCGDRAVLRALHFFDENERVELEEKALEKGDMDEFLKVVNDSGNSSLSYLQNIFSVSSPEQQGLTLALYTAKSILGNTGACRVHGGGFAGTIQAFVPNCILNDFRMETERIFGKGSCYELTIRNCGGTKVIF